MCCTSIHYESRELTFPLQNGSFIWSTLMAAVKTAEAIQRWGARYCDSQPTNCSFEVITQQVRAISSTMPETNEGGQARLMRSKPRGRLPVWVPRALKRRHLPWYPGNYLHLCGVYSQGGGGGGGRCLLCRTVITFDRNRGQRQQQRRAKHIVLLSQRKVHSRRAE